MAISFEDNQKNSFISASGRRFVSDAPRDYHYTSFETKNLLQNYSPDSTGPLLYKKESLVELIPHARFSRDTLTVSFDIRSGSSKQSYVLKDIMEFLHALDNSELVSYGKHLTFTHDVSAFSDVSVRIISFLRDYFREKQLKDDYTSYGGARGYSYSYAKGHAKSLDLKGHEIDEFFLAASDIYFQNKDFRARYTYERLLGRSESFPDIGLRIEKTANGINFDADAFTMFEGYSYIYFERRKTLHMIPRRDCSDIIPFLAFISARRTESELFIAEKDLSMFSTGLFPVLEEFFNVTCEGFNPSVYTPDVPVIKAYLDMPNDRTVTCDIKAEYKSSSGMTEVFSILTEEDRETNVKRDLSLENRTVRNIAQYFEGLDEKKGILILQDESGDFEKVYDFLSNAVPALGNLSEMYLTDSVKSIRFRGAPRVSLGVSVVSDLLELSLVPEDLSLSELDDILGRYDRKKKYYRLKSGEILDLSGNEMDLLYSLRDGLGLTSSQILEGHASVPAYRALFLDDLSEKALEYQDVRLTRSRDFKKLKENIIASMSGNYNVPKSLSDVMRDYQKKGFSWLRSLKDGSFGGILADDMGLGKTLQVLSLLLSIKEENQAAGRKNRCSLIVCPASLVYNWQHEIKKFTPELKSDLAVGIKPSRERVTSEIDEEELDVLITSYDLLRRDIEMYKYLHFECMIIDEAQFIKNPSTQAAKAVKSINASFRAALTGTPIENRLSELWSIFDFCMPGYLFNYKRFKETIEYPAVSLEDPAAMDRLRKMIAPFVLRRLKKDVLKDLPEKLREDIVTAMSPQQEELYKAHLQKIKMMVSSGSDEEFNRDRITILSELTRLRQICCDPGLVYENYKGDSAKATLCIEMIKSAGESGHKVLLFSQFTSMLERLTALLTKENISYYLLTGATKKEDRIKMVDAFQEDDTPVFCISLKAGGTGLNLTAADIVIHYDHWWNVAVEEQATDRAHRIGQKNVVTVYRLIMQNTVEERIITLQNKKKELSDKLLGGGGLGSPTLSRQELLDLLG